MDLGSVKEAVIEELLDRVIFGAMELVSETNDVMFEKKSFREFSKHISQLHTIFKALQAKRVETARLESTTATLEALHSQLNRACNIIRKYKSGSKLLLMLNSHSVLKKMQELTAEIAGTIALLHLTNIGTSLAIKFETDKIINNLRSVEFSSRTKTDSIASEIEKSMASHEINRDHTMEVLNKIAEACGTSMNASLVQNELALLKQEKEEMEAQKQQSEAFQLSQLITFLYSSDMVPYPPEEELIAQQESLIDSLSCPLYHELMMEPVTIVCGHNFERKAIQEHFRQGMISCPICEQELPSVELTPNLSLLGSIKQWKQRDMDTKFQRAVSGINSNDHGILNTSLDSLQGLMDMPRYREVVSEKGLIPKMVKFLQCSKSNIPAVLKCLYHLSCHCDENKEIIVKEGALSYILKCFYNGETNTDAITILLELSTNENLREKIGNAKYCIPYLVSMLHNDNHDIAQKADKVLINLSSFTHFVIKMAEAGHFKPFVFRFTEGSLETRASMAEALVDIQIGDDKIRCFKHRHFICKLVEMLSSSSPACIGECLKCIKKLLLHSKMVKCFMDDTSTIPHLITLLSSAREKHWKMETVEVLRSLIANFQTSDIQKYPDLQDLQSQKNVNLFMRLATTAEPQLKVKSLQLLIVLTEKLEIAQNLVRSNKDEIDNLFASLNAYQPPEERKQVIKLIYNISKQHPAGVPLPAAKAKEYAIYALVAILNSSPDNTERSTAAGIISQLPANEILLRSEVLKTIQEVICTIDNKHSGIEAPINEDESLLENALAALVRYTQHTNPDDQTQVCEFELYPSLVRILYSGSSLAKEYAAIALAHLSQSTIISTDEATITTKQSNNLSMHKRIRFFPKVFQRFSSSIPPKNTCSIHGSSCSSKHIFCLVKADAVKPLVHTLSDTGSGAAEAALTALSTMLIDSRTVSRAVGAIVDNEGVTAIVEVLERGTLSAKTKALNLFHKILEHTEIRNTPFQRAERILIYLLTEDTLKKKAALVLRQMKILPDQSSFF
ncbi:U-box domain-containing protein [Thalictrum thalictroides]|uniref:RING-type E3 ubiquitin transferase n=1 Tax=Thalictrum thalictroides TaxID=46969 RepID=A0A7J6X1U5_THATH|nr:U-box domain-containing protein [Thalictrum thalictroides]